MNIHWILKEVIGKTAYTLNTRPEALNCIRPFVAAIDLVLVVGLVCFENVVVHAVDSGANLKTKHVSEHQLLKCAFLGEVATCC